MKILLLKDLNNNGVRRKADETLDVEEDTESEKAKHEDGWSYFVLPETGQNFQIRNTDFIVDEAI
jgi:hypothetical protein